jgi:hypothetical protein
LDTNIRRILFLGAKLWKLMIWDFFFVCLPQYI